MNLIYINFLFMFMIGLFSFCLNRKHLLLMLLSLEYIILSLYVWFFILFDIYNYDYYFSMIYLVFCVCESVLGLCILVSLIRMYGNDYFYSLNLC
uniref:NADH-ubiquinone oxidoreductase chain 4L n=1 Tax=Meru phyllisae TaxID=535381 RepID=S4SV34_9COLE|nr:NADH dehydrogenase subunit 4L [Meru phyllisae]